MGNIPALSCCTNPTTITKKPDRVAAGNCPSSRSSRPDATFAGQSPSGDKVDQTCMRDIQHMSSGYSSERVFPSHGANIHTSHGFSNPISEGTPPIGTLRIEAALLHPHSSTPSTSEPPSSSHDVQSPGNDTEQPSLGNGVRNENLSTGYSSEQVFLSHSGKQKDFAEQLWVDLTTANISCFFDKHSLLKGEEFPRRIFDAAEKCKVAVVVLSQDFIRSRWPMQELCAFVEARESTNRKLRILPLYFKTTPEELSQQIESIERDAIPEAWEHIMNPRKERIGRAACLRALKTLRRMNGRRYNQMEGEVAYRRQIVRDIRSLLPRNIKHEDPSVRGRERLCQVSHSGAPCISVILEIRCGIFKLSHHVVAGGGKPVRPGSILHGGVKVVGLYGTDGSGKTTMCKSLCDFYSDNIEGLRAFHAEFLSGGGLPVETLKRLVMTLTDTDERAVKFVNGYEESVNILKQRISGQRVFLALDNIPDRLKSFKEVQAYANVGFAEGSLILLTARTRDILDRIIPQNERSFMHVPSLTEEEAIDVLLHPMCRKACNLTAEERYIARECAELCRFGRGTSYGQGNYHPLALTAFGFYLCRDFTCNLSHWLQIPDQFREYISGNGVQQNPFYIFERCFNTWDPKYLRIFMLLTFYAPHFELTENFDYFAAVLKWLAEVSTSEDHQIMSDAIRALKEGNLIEGCERHRNSLRRLRNEVESNQLKEMEEWMSLAGENKIPILSRSMVEAIKFEDCKLIHRLNLRDCRCPNLRSITLCRNESLREVVGLNGAVGLEKLHLEKLNKVEELPGFQSLKNLRYLKLCMMPSLKEKPDLSNCLHLTRENTCISDCKWHNECHTRA